MRHPTFKKGKSQSPRMSLPVFGLTPGEGVSDESAIRKKRDLPNWIIEGKLGETNRGGCNYEMGVLQVNFLDPCAFGHRRLLGGFQIKSNGLPDIVARLLKRVPLGCAPGQGRNENGVSAFFRWLQNNA